ncbi:MAG: hypothetical protein QM497_06755 [Sulfurimonas sp.]
MSIKNFLFVILGLMLLIFAIYFKLEIDKLEDKNLELKISKRAISQEFKNYKFQEIQKKFLQEKKRTQEERIRLALEEEQLRTQKIKNLKIKVDTAFEEAQKIFKKYRNTKCKEYIIKEALNQHLVFIKNYQGVSVGSVKSEYLKQKTRAIGLEEIQKVRRHKEGFIKIKSADANLTQTIYVKDLGMYKLYIGSSTTF